MAAPTTLAAKGLRKTFRGQEVLKSVDFEASSGELIVIVRFGVLSGVVAAAV